MKYLFEKLLLEEEGFEDVESEEEVDTDTSLEDDTSVDTMDDESTDVETESTVEDEVDSDISQDETTDDFSSSSADIATTITYKVSFTLGKHDNWSRIDAVSEEEAEQLVRDYVTRKWPDREFEVVSVEEFDEEEMEESLNESLDDTQLTDVHPIETGAEVGMATVISDLIKDEYEAIDNYNSAIATAEAEGFGDMVRVLTEIQAEENLHIGQLQAIMNTLDPNAHLVDDGQAEGIEQLSGDLSMDGIEESLTEATHCVYFSMDGGKTQEIEFEGTEDECQDYIEKQEADNEFGDEAPERFVKRINEDLDDMSLQDQKMFIRCVNEIWNMSVMEWTQKYYDGLLEVTTVDTYDDIPDTSNLIEIGSSDLSQGTGNVIVYTYMNAGDGSLYRYASY